MLKIKVSVIIPTFERNVALKRAVESVLNQTFKEFEIIVINDSPNEKETIALLNEFNDKRIKYFRNTRKKGGNGARNTGIVNSKCDYIAFLDDDDEWLENKLQDQYDYLKNNDEELGGVWSGFLRLEDEMWKAYNNFIFSNAVSFSKEIIFGNISLCASSNLMIKKEVINKIGLFDESLLRHQDLDFVIRILRSFKLQYLNIIHLKVYPSGISNPFILERVHKQFLNKIVPELSKFNNKEKKIFFTHKYYTFAKLFSRNGNTLKTLIYLIKIHRYKLINPITTLKFLINAMCFSIKKSGN